MSNKNDLEEKINSSENKTERSTIRGLFVQAEESEPIEDIFRKSESRKKEKPSKLPPMPKEGVKKPTKNPYVEKLSKNPLKESDLKAAASMTEDKLKTELAAERAKPVSKKKSKHSSEPLASKKAEVVIKNSLPPMKAAKSEPTEKEDLAEKDISVEKDFSEGHINGVKYQESNIPPFIVLAGKFTRTLRSEYEDIRIYNNKHQSQKAEKPKEKEQKSAEKKPKEDNTVKTVYPTNSRAKSKVQRSAFEPLEQPIKQIKKKTEPKKKVQSAEVTEKPKPKTTKIERDENGRAVPPPMRRKKWTLPKVNFGALFKTEEDYEPNETEIKPRKKLPQLDDYSQERDAEEISDEINGNFRRVLVRSGVLLTMAILSIVLIVVEQSTSLFMESMKNGWLFYALLNFLIFGIAVTTSRYQIVNGLTPLRRFKGNGDTAAAVASVAVAIQSITAIFTPRVFVDGTMHIYVPIVIIALLLNDLGKLLILLRAKENFTFLTQPNAKYAGKIYTDIKNAEKMVSEFPNKKTIIGYMRRSKFMSNFLQLSYAPDPSETLASKSAPITAVVSFVIAIVYGIYAKSFAGGVSSFALTACISTPIICMLSVNIPLLRLCRSTLKSGAMVTSYETVKQFGDTNAIMLDSSQLYPQGTVTLSGVKAIKSNRLQDAMSAGAAVMYSVNGTMSGIFDDIVHCSREMLPKVDSVVYEDNNGLVAWVEDKRVLIGNRDLMISHNVTANLPSKEEESKYRDDINDIMYISISGELIAMFVLAYNPTPETIHELRNLEENGVSFIIRTVDPNITNESVARKFYLYHRCVTILPTALGNICYNVTSQVDDTSRAYLVTRGRISAFAKAISGCIKIKSNVTITKILQYVAIVLGLVIITGISFISGFQKLGCLEMLIYLGFWAIASIIVSLIRK